MLCCTVVDLFSTLDVLLSQLETSCPMLVSIKFDAYSLRLFFLVIEK